VVGIGWMGFVFFKDDRVNAWVKGNIDDDDVRIK